VQIKTQYFHIILNINEQSLCSEVGKQLTQWAKSPNKQSEGVRICYCVKNTLLQTAFSAILPTDSNAVVAMPLKCSLESRFNFFNYNSLCYCFNQPSYPYPNPLTAYYWQDLVEFYFNYYFLQIGICMLFFLLPNEWLYSYIKKGIFIHCNTPANSWLTLSILL